MRDDPPRPSRRRFLEQASMCAAVAAAHRQLAWAAPMAERSATGGDPTEPRILALRLLTQAPLPEMKAFYAQTLGLPVLEEGPAELTIGGGATTITFVRAKEAIAGPFYHFAFNIPENKLLQARNWQRERTELLPIFPELRDPRYPDDVVHFRHWNAHSIFFFDPAGNVLEYIARHDLHNAADGPFGVPDILYASEIAFVADDVTALAAELREAFKLNQYRDGSDAFRAIGDERGLLLVFVRGRKLTFRFEKPKLADVFATQARISGGPPARYVSSAHPYEITRA